MARREDIVTPCCGAPLIVLTRQEGPAYLTYDVPDEICCTAPGCFNSWTANGEVPEWER